MIANFAKGVFARIDAVLLLGETRTDFVRTAVRRELRRRLRQAGTLDPSEERDA